MKPKIFLIIWIWLIIGLYIMPVKAEDHSPKIQEILNRLEKKISGLEILSTDFIQEKSLTMLDQKMIIKGTIWIQKPGMLAWHVKEPMQYSLVVKDDKISQWDEETKQVQQISLSKNPAFKTLIKQLREWFSGTYTSLLADYEVTLLEQNPVSLIFIPHKTSAIFKYIKKVKVIFRPDERYIQQIAIEENGGDSMCLTFLETRFNAPIDPSAWEVKRDAR